jgi:hypothetical protein
MILLLPTKRKSLRVRYHSSPVGNTRPLEQERAFIHRAA